MFPNPSVSVYNGNLSRKAESERIVKESLGTTAFE